MDKTEKLKQTMAEFKRGNRGTAKQHRRTAKLVSFLFALVGLGLIVGGIISFITTAKFVSASVETSGIVTGNQPITSDDDKGRPSTTYSPIVQFQTQNGESIEFVSASDNSSPTPPGEQVSVLYDPDHPQEAEINTFMAIWLVPTVVLVFGIMALLGALAVCWVENSFDVKLRSVRSRLRSQAPVNQNTNRS